MINHFKHIYPWRWIWLSDSIFINVGVIIILGALNKVGSLVALFLLWHTLWKCPILWKILVLQIYSVLDPFHYFCSFCCSCPCSVNGHVQQNLWTYWNLAGIDSCGEHCNLLFLIVALESPL